MRKAIHLGLGYTVVATLLLTGCGNVALDPGTAPRPTSSAPEPRKPARVTPRLVAHDRRTCQLRSSGGVACWGDDLSRWSEGPTVIKYLEAVALGFRGDAVVFEDRAGKLLATPPGVPSDAGLLLARPELAGVAGSCSHGACCDVVDGAVVCSGSNDWNRLGGDGPDREAAAPVPGIDDAVAVAVGSSSACAITQAGKVRCWGSNQDGQIGSGSTERGKLAPDLVRDLADIVQIVSGVDATCARTRAGHVHCWGSNLFGALGRDVPYESNVPLRVEGIPEAVDLAFDSMHVCAVARDGTVWCWGHGDYGQLGHGEARGSKTPVKVAGIVDATAVATGSEHSCALHRDESVSCWGNRTHGRLGDGVSSEAWTPQVVEGLGGVASVCTQSARTCALGGDHTLSCWDAQSGPHAVRSDVLACDESCLVLTSGAIECEPAHPAVDRVLAVASAHGDGCALRQDGTVTCWGDDGQPPRVVMKDAASVAVGRDVACSVSTTGDLWCWGDVARMSGPARDPVRAEGIAEVGPMVLDRHSALAGGVFIRHGGQAFWWYWAMAKLDAGQLRLREKPFVGVEDAAAIAGGPEYGCVSRLNGRVQCWGDNTWGEIGDGTRERRKEPAFVSGLDDAVSVAAGYDFRCASHRDGRVSCWGNNERGQLGRKFVREQTTPVAVQRLR